MKTKIIDIMKTKKIFASICCLGLFMLLINSCNDDLEDSTFFTTDDMNITQTLESNPEKFSMYVEILEKTEFYTSLASYGSYTCLAPTNEALQTYLEKTFNVSTVAEVTSPDQIEFLKIIVKFHTLPTRRATSSFIEGRIADTTYTGDHLTTSFLSGGGIANIKINREVGLDQFDIDTDNGIIHALDGVLSPFVDGVPTVMENGGAHTIFIEALKQTGYFDEFNILFDETGVKNNFTILAESDEIYSQNGINSFTDLVNAISPDDSDYLNVNNALNRFMAYHVTGTFLYSADFPIDGFISTVLPKNAIKSLKTDTELRINETETGTNDTWTSLISEQSNIPAKNGVYHTVDKILNIFIPNAKRIIFDFGTDLLEVKAGQIAFRTWYESDAFKSVRVFPATRIRILTNATAAYDGRSILNLPSVTWIEWDTPVLPKGKYEVRVSGNQGNNGRPILQAYWDGVPIGSQWDMRTHPGEMGIFGDSLAMRDRGYVRGLSVDEYPAASETSAETPGFSRFIITSDLLCPVQESHVFRFETIRSGGIPIDYVEFVPVD